jgi:hypothetical protein
MANASQFPISSFMNLFKNIVYDKSQTPNYSLDIWDAYTISPFFKNELAFFQTHILQLGDNWASLAIKYYGNDRYWWIIPLFNDLENPFIIYDSDLYRDEIQELKILKPQYVEQMIMIARQNKITNDRLLQKGIID